MAIRDVSTAATPGARLEVRLLVVDDDDVDRERVLRLLQRSSLDVRATEAASSADALRLVRMHEFDCVMLDNQLGDANGAELLPTLRRESLRDCPIIMVTGAGDEALAVRALRHGAVDYLTKTRLDSDVLVRAICNALEHHKMQLEIDVLHHRLRQRIDEQEAQIVQRDRDLKAILDHTPSVIGYWDARLRNRFGNQAHHDWLGVDALTLPGRHLREVIGADGFASTRSRVEAVLRGQSQRFEQDFMAPDGVTLRHTQVSLYPDMADDGTVRGFYSTLTDVTPMKQAQARAEELARFAEAVIDNSPVGCGVYRADGHCVMCNQALAAVGVRQSQALGLWSWLSERAPVLDQPAHATLADGSPRRVDVELRGEAGMPTSISCTLARIGHAGQPHLLLFAIDVTEQRRLHDAMASARDLAESAARTKTAFLANMSHEIRTPMNAIVGLSRLVLEGELPSGAREYLDKVYNAAVALLGLLDDVLDYSKIEAGQLRFEQLDFELEQALKRTVDVLGARIDQKGLELVVDLPPDLPRWLVGDPLRLSQVLNNLVGNAEKFTEAGHIHLIVRELPTIDPRRCLLRVSVQDTGVGIDVARANHLFEAFAQADSSITRRFGGTGLGLAICKRLVEMMGGQIGVVSSPGCGSEFWFTVDLPRAGENLERNGRQQHRVAGLRLLLVGGGTLASKVIDAQLQAWRVCVTHSGDVRDALQLVARAQGEACPFDVVLLDWQALDPAGQHAARQLWQGPPQNAQAPPRVLVTAFGRDAPICAPGSGAPDAVLIKPVMVSALLEALCGTAPGSAEPLAPPPTGVARAASQASLLKARAAPLAGARILLAEDNPVNQLVAQQVLERMGFKVHVVANGAQALAALEEAVMQPFDAVLMDLHMPVMDGLEATRRIRERVQWAVLPVIAMTAAALPEDHARCLEVGMVDHVAKPLVPERLLDALLKWIPPKTGSLSRALPESDKNAA